MPFLLRAENAPVARAGVYVLRHIPTNRHYVGISINVKRRVGQHATGHSPPKLKNAIKKYGSDQFEALPVYYLIGDDLEHLKAVEASWIVALDCLGSGGFNLLAHGGTVGVLSPEASAITKARWRDPVMRDKIMRAMCAAQRSEKTKNKRRTPDKIDQLTRASRAMRQNPASVAKLRASLSASWTKERKNAFSKRVKEHWNNPEWRHRVLETRRATNANSDVNQRRSAAIKGFLWATNGRENARLRPADPLPEGWWYGRGPSPRKGLVGVTNGDRTRFISPGDPLPEGWWYGNITKGRPKPRRLQDAA